MSNVYRVAPIYNEYSENKKTIDKNITYFINYILSNPENMTKLKSFKIQISNDDKNIIQFKNIDEYLSINDYYKLIEKLNQDNIKKGIINRFSTNFISFFKRNEDKIEQKKNEIKQKIKILNDNIYNFYKKYEHLISSEDLFVFTINFVYDNNNSDISIYRIKILDELLITINPLIREINDDISSLEESFPKEQSSELTNQTTPGGKRRHRQQKTRKQHRRRHRKSRKHRKSRRYHKR